MKTMHKSELSLRQSWRSILTMLAFVACLFPYSVAIGSTLDDGVIEADLMTSPEFELSQNSGSYLYSAASSLGEVGLAGNASIEAFYQRLHDTSIANLGSATYVPISVGDINFVIPTYNNPIHVGDAFVQSRYIRFQVRELLGRHLVNADDPAYANEAQQLATLYQNAYSYALTSKNLYGTRLTMARDASTIDMIWPEIRNIHGQNVVVPVLYLTSATVANRRVSEHEVFFGGNVTFNSISLTDVNIKAGRQTFINAVHDLTVDGAKILGSGDLSLVAGGNINLLSGEIRSKGELQLGADGNISLKSSTINSNGSITVSAQNLTAQTVVQRVDYGNGHQGSSYGRITSINSANGDVTVHTSKDIILQGVRVTAGEGITFGAGGNIYIGSVALNDSFTGRDGNWNVQNSSVDYLVSSLSAEETIQLMAGGHITLDAAQIASDEGHIEILAGLGITIEDEMAEHRTYQKGKFGKKKKEITDYQTVAIRSILDAGKGVRLHTDFGDITLKATEITSAEGAHVSASNGKVNLLLSKELDHYSYVSTYKGTFKIKNRNEGHYIETAIPNAIVGGLKVEAAYGLNVEYPGDPNLTLDEQIDKLSQMQGFEWMKDVRNDPNVNWIEAQLAYETWKENNTSLSPAFAALITVVVACVTGGIGLAGMMTTAVGGSAVLGGALAAGITTMATQSTIALASGNIRSISDMVELHTSSETMKAVASSMITAGAVASVNSYFETGNFFDMKKATDAAQAADTVVSTAAGEFTVTGNELADQVVQAVTNATVKAGVSTLVYGGGSEDFKNSFTQSLMQGAIDEIGAEMAKKIGGAFDHSIDGVSNFDTAMKYIAHAGAGCVIGVASAKNSGESESSAACSSGAGGAVVGELIGDIYRSDAEVLEAQQAVEKIWDDNQDLVKYYRALGYSEDKIRAILVSTRLDPRYVHQLDDLKRHGVNIAKFGAALSAFIAGADASGVNIAANAGENSAENNATLMIDALRYLLMYSQQDFDNTVGPAEAEVMAVGDALIEIGVLAKGALESTCSIGDCLVSPSPLGSNGALLINPAVFGGVLAAITDSLNLPGMATDAIDRFILDMKNGSFGSENSLSDKSVERFEQLIGSLGVFANPKALVNQLESTLSLGMVENDPYAQAELARLATSMFIGLVGTGGVGAEISATRVAVNVERSAVRLEKLGVEGAVLEDLYGLTKKSDGGYEVGPEIVANGGGNVTSKFVEVYGKAPAAKIEIDSMADEIVEMFGGRVAKAPIKSQERAIEKIMNDYDGDATKIKDLARNTIVVSPEKMDAVVAELVNRGANVKVINGATDPLGYSGINSTIKTQTGIFGEVQVNTPAMIYAKESEPMARVLLGDDLYTSIASKSGMPGGQGHKFYEQWRVLSPNSYQAQAIAEQSRAYYEAIRRANGY